MGCRAIILLVTLICSGPGWGVVTIKYDPVARIYAVGNNNTVESLVYPDGTIDSTSPALSPFDRHFERLIVPDRKEISVDRVAGRTGVMLEERFFYSLSAEGRHRVRDIFDDGTVPCTILDPRDVCFFFRGGVVSDFELALVFHRSLGNLMLQYKNGIYENVSGPLAQLSVEDLFTAVNSSFQLVQLGPRWLIVPSVGAYLNDNVVVTVVSSVGVTQEKAPLGGNPFYATAQWPRVYDDAIFLPVTLRGRDVSAKIFAAKEVDGDVKVAEVAAATQEQKSLVGIDADGYAYYVAIAGGLSSYHLQSQTFTEIGECSPSSGVVASLRGVGEDSGVWWLCGSDLVSLRGGKILSRTSLSQPIDRVAVGSLAGESLDALAVFRDGKMLRIDQGEFVESQRLRVAAAPPDPNGLFWSEGPSTCGVEIPAMGAKRTVGCMVKDRWQTSARMIEPPLDIYESTSLTWALTEGANGTTRLYRMERTPGAVWELASELPQPESQAVAPALIPSSTADEVGIFLPGTGIYRLSPGAEAIRLPIAVDAFNSKVRPVFGEGGWIYGQCLDPGSRDKLCSFAPDGTKNLLSSIPVNSLGEVLPLRRGAFFRIPESPAQNWILHNRSAIALGTLYGEFRVTARANWRLNAFAGPEGDVYLEKSMSRGEDETTFSYFRFDGRLLDKLERDLSKSGSDKSTSVGSGSSTVPYTWPRFNQAWRHWDGLWRKRSVTVGGLPFRVGASPTELYLNLPLDFNDVSAVAVADDRLLLANPQGIWICEQRGAVPMGAEVWRIRRNPWCTLTPWITRIRQLITVTPHRVLALAGTALVQITWNSSGEATFEQVLADVGSERVGFAENILSALVGDDLQMLDLSSGSIVHRSPLPTGVGPRDVRAVEPSYLCAKQGLFVHTNSTPILMGCDAIVSFGTSAFVASAGAIYRCDGETCAVKAPLPLPRAADRAMLSLAPGSGDLLVAQGRMLFGAAGDRLEPCGLQWGHGPLPKASVTGIADGFIATAGGGVFKVNCAAQEYGGFRIQ